MNTIGVPLFTYKELRKFLADRGVDIENYRFRASEYAQYVKMIDMVILEGIKAIEEFEEFDRYNTTIEKVKRRIEEARE